MRVKSGVWVALLAIALGSVFAVGATNPTVGPDNAPYFSDEVGAPKSCFVPDESVYVSYFDTTNNYNNHITAIDTMYVSIDSQSTENIAVAGWAPDAVSGTITDGGDVGTVPGDGLTDNHIHAGGGPNAAVLVLIEVGLDSGLFIGNVGTTPVTILGGDMVTVGLIANDQDKAYIKAQLLGWWDSVSTPDPGNAGSYGAGDDIVLKLTAHAANSWTNATAGLYYQINAGTWQNGVVWTDVTGTLGGAYPDRYLEIRAPGTTVGDTVDVLWQPGTTPPPLGCSTTVMKSTTIVDQPVDLANATYTTTTVAPDNYSPGFVRDYMTIHAANDAVGGDNWTIGVHGDPAVPAYDSTFDTFPIVINPWNNLTIIGGSQPIVEIDNGALGFDIQGGGDDTTIDNLSILSSTQTGSYLVQLTGAPADVTIQNCTFDTVGSATAGIKVAPDGSTRLTIDNNVWTAMDAGDSAIWTDGPNPNITVTNNTFNGGGTAAGACIEGSGWSNGLIDNNAISNTAVGINLMGDNGVVGQLSTPVTITRNTITNSADGIKFNSNAALGSIANVTIEGNLLTGNTNAIRVDDVGGVINSATFTVKYNHIVGNSAGISDTDTGGVLNAELNWWGSTTGPAHALNADGVGDPSTDNVDYRPWLNGAPAAGVGATLAANTDTAAQGNKTVQGNSWYWTINQALAAEDAVGCGGGTPPCRSITVVAGSNSDSGNATYAEEIDVSAYTNLRYVAIVSDKGRALVNIEAGQNANILHVGAGQNLTLGTDLAEQGFSIYFDANAVPEPDSAKIEHGGEVLNVFGCLIDGTKNNGINVESEAAAATGTIRNNTIRGCKKGHSGHDYYYGIYLGNVSDSANPAFTIDNNVLTDNDTAIRIRDGRNVVTNNTVQFNGDDGLIIDSDSNTIGGSGNKVLNNHGAGIVLNGNRNTVTGNTIHANGDEGISITGDDNVFNGNAITSNGAEGVELTSAANGNVFNETPKTPAGTNCIYDNDRSGESPGYLQMRNRNTGTNVDATSNYWGSAAGPFHAMYNPSGDPESRVSDFVLIDPWAITCAGGQVDATITLACGAGWYLTSIPLVPADTVAQDVYDELPVFGAYQYNPTTGTYVNLTDQPINWSDGYWLWLMGDETVTVEGAPVTTDQVFTLGDAGWQQFSIPSVDMPVTGPDLNGNNDPDIEFSVDGITWYTYTAAAQQGLILEGIFKWDACYVDVNENKGRYEAMGYDGVLDPWLGYWIETLVPAVQVRVPVAYWIANPWTTPRGFRPMSIDTHGRTPPKPPVQPRGLQAAYDPATGLVVMNEPNPIRDVNTTTFRVMSAKSVIDEIRVEIFDQNGALVFADTQLGSELVWHTQNDYGEFLANGIYLYRVSANINGQWVVTEVRKLAIYR
jgi:hypothetical protein